MAKKPSPPPFRFGAAMAPPPDALVAQARVLHQAGRAAQAQALCREVLRRTPRHFGALHLLGLLAFEAGHVQSSAELLEQATQARPGDADAHADLGFALYTLGRHAQALASLDRALALDATRLAAINNRGNTLAALGRRDEAIAAFDRALALRPDYVEAVYNRGNAEHGAGRLDAALASYDHVIAARPDIAQAHNNRARVLQDLGRHEEAHAGYARALALVPAYAGALFGRGSAALALGRPADALADFEAALALAPLHVQAHYDRGNALAELRRTEEAVAAFTRCLELDPLHRDARVNRGNARRQLRQHLQAVADYELVLRDAPTLAGVACNRGDALLDLFRYDEAADAFARVLELDPGYPYALGKRVYALALACDWREREALLARVAEGLAAGRPTIAPFALQALSDSPATLKRCAELFAADQFPARPARVAPGHRYGHARIRLAYLAGEFRHQATAILATELFELHDKARFELVFYDNGWDDGSALRQRIVAAADELVDISHRSDDEVAGLIAAREIDIFVNLNGWFGLGRTGVFMQHPAPVQLNWLGFPGTLGSPCMDAILADAHTIPPGEEGAYSERVVRLPDTYQPNDRQRRIAEARPTRAAAGLPAAGTVFACFNNTYKITPSQFASWMRILAAVEASVLWLLDDNPAATANLRAAARAQGIDAERLCFAPRVPLDEHLARHALADLFLDTLPYNAHTTASDALWAGLPVLSCRGTSFPGRVGASLLHALGLADELLVDDPAAYEARAIALGRDAQALARLRATLAARREAAPLFDTPRFARAFEAALEGLLASA